MKRVNPQIAPKIAFLRLAEELGNISQACRITGYSRDTYYRLKKLFDTGGEAALRNRKRSRELTKNQVDIAIQKHILKLACEHPELGQKRVAERLSNQGMEVSQNGVRSVWLRYDLETHSKRLQALQAKCDQGELLITEKQMEAFRFLAQSLMDGTGELVSKYPGYLLVQDTFEVDHFPELAPLYLHVVIDSYTRHAFARYYTTKSPETSADFLAHHVFSWYANREIQLQKILTDRGAEFVCPKTPNKFQVLLQNHSLVHLLVKAYNSSKLNGICRQFEKLVETEFFHVAARKNQFAQLSVLQIELDQWLHQYNTCRPQPARYCYGKTPLETINSAIHLCATAGSSNAEQPVNGVRVKNRRI